MEHAIGLCRSAAEYHKRIDGVRRDIYIKEKNALKIKLLVLRDFFPLYENLAF